jgi:Tol biopolymer transport system component/DNA-binding winged helix-turn-helix (wHTH) protein
VLQSLKVFRFGDFDLDCAQRRLLHGSQDLYLPPKTFELLLYLIQNRRRVVEKGELLDSIWPGVNVTENTLAQRIREVREALGADGGADLIRTIPRVGYLFVGEVEEVTGPARRGLDVWPASRGKTRVLWPYLAGFAVLSAAGIAATLTLSRVNTPVILADHRLVSGSLSSPRDPSLSPNDGTMAFVEDVDGRPQIWIKSVTDSAATQLTFLDGAGLGRTRWSPTRDQILFNYAGGIWSVSPLGGAPRQIIPHGRNASLSADGAHLVYEGLGVPDGDRGIWIAKIDGTNVRRVLEKRFNLAGTPAVSPDGRSIVFFQSHGGPMGDLWVVPASGGPERRLTFDDAEAGTPTWTPDGRFIIFSSERAGSRTLWRVPAPGGEPEAVTSGAGEDSDPQISADGRRLIYTNVRNGFSLELLVPTTGSKQTLMQSRTRIGMPRFSPDGNRIVFFHHTAAGVHVFTIGADGGDLWQVTSRQGERNIIPRWSARGDSLLFSQTRPKDSLRKVSARGGDSTEVMPWAWDTRVELDPREQAIVFVRGRQTVIRQLQSGRETTLDHPLTMARWSTDGQMILGTETVRAGNFDTWNIVRCTVATSSCSTLTSGHNPVPSSDSQRIYFMRPGTSGMRSLWSADLDGRDERQLADIGPFLLPDVSFDVSPNQTIVWPAFHAGKSEIWMATLR